MNSTGCRFLVNEARRLTLWSLNLAKRMTVACFKAQFNAAVLPAFFIYGGVKYVYEYYYTESEREQTPEPSSEDIARATRKLRENGIKLARRNMETNSMASTSCSVNEQQSESLGSTDISLEEFSTLRSCTTKPKAKFLEVNEFSGGDLLWDVPVIWEKAQYFQGCIKEKESTELALARNALEEHPIKSKMPKTRLEYENILTKARNGIECSIVPEAEDEHDFPYKDMVHSNICDSITTTLNIEESRENKLLDHNDSQSRCCQWQKTQCNNQFSTKCKTVHLSMEKFTRTFRKIQATCNEVIEGLTNVNDNLNTIIRMRKKLNELEYEAEEMKKLYENCVRERSELRDKIFELEKLINEEEMSLNCSSLESGFHENENTGNSNHY